MRIIKCYFTKNDCYKAGKKIKPKGILVHSTGANNPKLSRYIQPDDGILGVNKNNNHWNMGGVPKCVHAFIGLDKNGEVRVYQVLPWNYRCWGCGSGKKGSYNDSYIQFEICEDALKDEKYFDEVFDKAIELCKELMELYPSIKLKNIVSHKEAHARGYASNHGDCDHWLKKFGKDMDWFRNEVKTEKVPFSTRVANVKKGDVLKIRKKASKLSKKTGELKYNDSNTYTIVEVKNGWGKLKSGVGWINLKYTKKV